MEKHAIRQQLMRTETELVEAQQQLRQKVNKWKNHFFEMKGDIGMSLHEKEEQEDA